MREYIERGEYKGQLKVEDESMDVVCIYEDDYYSNTKMNGEFRISSCFTSDELSRFIGKPFEFRSDAGQEIKGKISWSTHNFGINQDARSILKFKAESFYHHIKYNEKDFETAEIIYQIPYIKPFARDIYSPTDDCILQFTSKPTIFTIDKDDLMIDERIYLTEYQAPDSVLRRETQVIFKKEQITNSDFKELLEKSFEKINEVLLMLSFVLEHRISSFGYHARFFSEGQLVQTIDYKESGRECGEDLLKSLSNKNDFKNEIIEKFIQSYLKHEQKNNIKRIIFRYLMTLETPIFEAKFLSSYSLLEGISKIVVNSSERRGPEELIKSAAEKSNVDLDFIERKNSKKLKWYITEYRNYLMHFNDNLPIVWDELIKEYGKIIELSRKLILYKIASELPYISRPTY